MPKEAIDRIHTLARRCHALRKPIFYSRDGTSIITDDPIETAGAENTPLPPANLQSNDDDSDYSDSSYDDDYRNSNTSESDSSTTEAPDTDSGDETASTNSSYHTSDGSESNSDTSDDDTDSFNG